MGISGLIPFLEKASVTVNIKELTGASVAVDSYCWLHKGVFACAEKLIRGETTNIHIQYCLKYLDMLLKHKITVIMVFDGMHLPAKAEIEQRRRKARKESKQLAKQYLRSNEIEKARSHMRRAVDVTHEMALELIKACRDRGVDCIVAPYEADAQMAWLNKQGLAEYVITEDSDLTLFGAQKILFKLDLTGQALLVENTKLHLAMGCKPEKYTFDKFCRMCILSGCDYLDSLHGIGLKKACKFFLITDEDNIARALKKIPSYLKMKQLVVTNDYIESFMKAEATFKHMFIYNPLERKMQRLHELHEFQTDESYCSNAGSLIDNDDQAFQLALGNLNPFTLKKLYDWHPSMNWSKKNSGRKSIWLDAKDFQDGDEATESKQDPGNEPRSIFHFKKIEFKNMAEMEIADKRNEEKNKLEESEIFSMYKFASPELKEKRKRRNSSLSSSEEAETEEIVTFCDTTKKCAYNPFAKFSTSSENKQKSQVCSSNSLLKVLSPKKANSESDDSQTIASKKAVKSRFFAKDIKESTKLFAARDLTSEMLTIEKKTNEYIEQQQNLYYSSLQSPKRDIKDEVKVFSDQIRDRTNEYNEEVIAPDAQNSSSSQETKACDSSSLDNETILLSDIEEEEYSQKISTISVKFSKTKNKLQSTSRKLKKIDPKQPKLSMFGFQKRPTLKKL